jgi:hypothetical protein
MSKIHMIFGPQGVGKSAHALALAIDSHYVTAPHDLRRRRVLARNQEKSATFAFEVTPMMFDFMENEFEPATQAELENCNLVVQPQ